MRVAAALAGLVLATGLRAQGAPDPIWRDSLEAYWDRINETYRDTAHSPLLPKDRQAFIALERFPVDPAYRVTARFKPARDAKPFTMRTTTQREPIYVPYGTLEFKLKGRKCRLTVYQAAVPRPGLERHLFLPFTDATNGSETYGGGRYLDLTAPLGPSIELDFNRAYNPYCAYGGSYSCPIPPKENHLTVAIPAGVLKFHD